jgi:hypothetical protein
VAAQVSIMSRGLIANNLKVKGLVVKLPEFNRIFTNCFQIGKIVHQVHGPVDFGGAWSTGLWWTTDGGSRKAHRSPALQAHRWVRAHQELGEKEEELRGVLTKGGAGRWTAGGEPAMVGNKWVMTKLDGRAIRVWMERADARNGKVVWRRCSRVPFIGWGWREVSG